MKKTKQALILSFISMMLCISMLVGATFAWFTDTVTSSPNIIKSGNLDVEMYWTNDLSTGVWYNAETEEDGVPFDYDNWEPGYTEVRYVKVVNAGSLALKYSLTLGALSEVGKLAEVIGVYYANNVTANIADRSLAGMTSLGYLSDAMNGGEAAYGSLAPNGETVVAVALHMDESAGNDYQEESVGDGFVFKLVATQATAESDSFDDQYDKNAEADFFPGFQGGSANIAVKLDDQSTTTTEVDVDAGDVSAVIPAGVKLADGVGSLELNVTMKDTSESNIKLSETEKMRALDVHIEGVAEGNTTPMLITLEQYLTIGINTGAIKIYHVEDGETVVMTQVANPVNHNEFSYDPLTGNVTLALASFSEVAVVADTNNPWDGKTATAFTGSGTETDPYLIANADNLAYFRDLVDGKTVVEGFDPTFAGKFVKLNNNIYLSGKNFDPIGWGYDYDGYTPDGKTFNGTFDGNNNFIFDLCQDGWDLGYSYSMAGGGLFASVVDATIQNLKISGANIRMECIDMGVLVGYSQGNCTYKNIDIYNSKIANYQRSTGGVVGEVTCKRDSTTGKSTGENVHTFENVNVHNDVVVGTLWGDFDASCGGVIGGRWDDDNTTKVVMKNVVVRCRLDVYNDITSAYQWHAYRRAGMLIGNTDLPAGENRLAQAPFLECENVDVYYGDWVNYTYCNFSNHNPRYPWVRTQVGENCNAFSNPRWGVPNDANGNLVTDMNHKHQDGDECGVLRQFAQLYGGGQGVYGQHSHDNVTVRKYEYSITYVNDSKVLDIVYVTDNTKSFAVGSDQAKKLVDEWAKENMKDYNGYAFGGWMTAASVKLAVIPEGNTQNIVLYPYFTSPYTASFVDENSNILAWCFFNEINVDNLPDAFAEAKKNLPNPGEGFELIYWDVRGTDTNGDTVKVQLADDNTNWESFKGYKDVTIRPHYRYNGAELIEVYDDLTGEIDHYKVAGYADGVGSTLVEIPAYVNGKPVTIINDGAFKSYDDIYAAKIPETITSIGSNAFTELSGSKRDQVTLYYQGDPNDWKQAMDDLYVNKSYSYYTDYNTAGTYTETAKLKLDSSWDSGAGDGSRIFFLDENGKVDQDAGYWELCREYKKNGSGLLSYGYVYIWVFHDHVYDNALDTYKNCVNEDTHYGSFTDYYDNTRPDVGYWKED